MFAKFKSGKEFIYLNESRIESVEPHDESHLRIHTASGRVVIANGSMGDFMEDCYNETKDKKKN